MDKAISSAGTGYPSFESYKGGGTILNKYTSVKNLERVCSAESVSMNEVAELIWEGMEVLVSAGQIRAVRRYD